MTKHTLYIESLGCPKNSVDSEVMLASLLTDGWRMVDDPSEARLIILNSCAFIEEAREETIRRLFSLHAARRKGSRLILAGCLPQRYPSIHRLLPEVDIVVGIDDIPRIAAIAKGIGQPAPIREPRFLVTKRYARMLSLSPFTAYLKIADGCDNRCTYCVIPTIRGCYRERSVPDIVGEARHLVAEGIRELVLIAQDTSMYGRDHSTSLGNLITRLSRLPGRFRIRVMYLHPFHITERILDAFLSEKVVPYFEIPIQHINDRLLAAMNRQYRRRDVEQLLEHIESRFGTRAVIRTTFIAGFPTETPAEHDELRRFIETAPLDYIGLFAYSKEERTPAAAMKSLRRDTVARRTEELRRAAQETMERRLSRFVGTTMEVLYEEFDEKSCLPISRGYHQAPEIDGITILTNLTKERPGSFLLVRITQQDGIDFIAETIPKR